MAKKIKQVNKSPGDKPAERQENKKPGKTATDDDRKEYLWSMSHAQPIDQGVHWFQLLPIAFFTAVIIMITRMASYTMAMDQFPWTDSNNNLQDFFSYYKMVFILICAALALVLFLYRAFTQSLAIKRSVFYIPMAVYMICVGLSYALSDYKDFALLGYHERFEGTLTLLAYMTVLFYIINSINTERGVKWILYPVAATSTILSVLGISQYFGKDFFQTGLGQKLLVPNGMTESGKTVWEMIDIATEAGQPFLKFNFTDGQIYQTVYNINYVSFYLTLLLPLFGLLFIRSVLRGKEEKLWKKIAWGVLFGLLIFNLIGSQSSGGFLGMGIAVLIALILLNKRILSWWKPVVMLLIITALVGGFTHERWLPELTSAFHGVSGSAAEAQPKEGEQAPKSYIDYLATEGNKIEFSVDGNPFVVETFYDSPMDFIISDSDNKPIKYHNNEAGFVSFEDERLANCGFYLAQDDANTTFFVLLINDDTKWPFAMTADGTLYMNELNKSMTLKPAPHYGFESNQAFGSGRGYIWSRTFPMMKDTLLLGHGADTYCLYFPQYDYAGKYNAAWNINMIVDKPHNMYMGMCVGTGGISMLAFLTILGLYAVQSAKIFRRRHYDSFLDFAGVGIFLGVMGFAAAGLVDDSTVSVMPLFYGLLGTGIAANMILAREQKKAAPEKEAAK